MKRIISLLLAAVMVLSLCACGSSKPQKKSLDELTAEDFQAAAEQLMGEEAETQAPTEVEQKVYKLGETITMMDDMIEFTVNDFFFSESVNRSDVTIPTSKTDDYLIEKATEGKTFLICSATINYKGSLKKDFRFYIDPSEGSAKVDYNNGYEFNAGINTMMIGGEPTHSNAVTFEPLSDSKTAEYRGYFEVPKVVESDTESPLLLELVVVGATNGSDYYYVELPITIQLR